MKNLGIAGAVAFAVAVFVGCFCNFPADTIIEITLSAFGLAAIVLAAINKAKKEGNYSWKTTVVITGAVVGGVLCAIGGYDSSNFKIIAGAVVAIVAAIFSQLKLEKK